MKLDIPLRSVRELAIAVVMLACATTLICCMENVKEESFPWPEEPVDAVYRALLGVEGRNWDLYASSFEPTTVLTPTYPGVPGIFGTIHLAEIARDDRQAVVRVTAFWQPSDDGWIDALGYGYLDADILVVRAKKPLGGKVTILEGVNAEATIYEEGWYICHDQADKIPFNLNERDRLVPYQYGSLPGSFVFVRDGHIWLQAASRASNTVQLTQGASQDSHPDWSPDSRKVEFFRKDVALDGTHVTRFCTIDPEGTGLSCTSDAIGDVSTVVWSPEGEHLVAYDFIREDGQGAWHIKFIADAGLQHIILPRDRLAGARLPSHPWSSDGTTLVMTNDGNIDLYDIESTTLREFVITQLNQPDVWWAADSLWLVYTGICTESETLELGGIKARRSCLRTVSRDGSIDRPLAIGRSWQVAPIPNETWVLATVQTESGTMKPLLIDLVTGQVLSRADPGLEYLLGPTTCEGSSSAPWSPSGRVFFRQGQSERNTTGIYLTHFGAPSSVSQLTLPWRIYSCMRPKWSSDGTRALIHISNPQPFPFRFKYRVIVLDVQTAKWWELSGFSNEEFSWVPGTHWTYTIRTPLPDVEFDESTPTLPRQPSIFLKHADTGEWRWVSDHDAKDSEPAWGSYEIGR